jgi:SAM-dependent methyltransferase
MTAVTTTPAELVSRLVRERALTGASFSRPRRPDPDGARRVTVDPVLVRGALRYRFRRHEPARTVDETLPSGEAEHRLVQLVEKGFRQAILHEAEADWQVLAGGRGATILRRAPTRPSAGLAHDRARRRTLAEGEPVPFLVALGVQAPDGRVRPRRQAKFRQVCRFLELVEDVLPELPDGRPLRVVDFGSGRSYLTFALHHLLTAVHGREVELVGLDLRPDVVDECEALARRLGAAGLRFEVADIAERELDGVDLVVSLHACDTATDHALAQAVHGGARVVLAVPCCQHELAGQLADDTLAPLLRHGILRERLAADVTDAARARLLELAGYRVQLVEFVDTDHTPKNVLIRAVRTTRPVRDRERLAREYRAFADALRVRPTLERLLPP